MKAIKQEQVYILPLERNAKTIKTYVVAIAESKLPTASAAAYNDDGKMLWSVMPGEWGALLDCAISAEVACVVIRDDSYICVNGDRHRVHNILLRGGKRGQRRLDCFVDDFCRNFGVPGTVVNRTNLTADFAPVLF